VEQSGTHLEHPYATKYDRSCLKIKKRQLRAQRGQPTGGSSLMPFEKQSDINNPRIAEPLCRINLHAGDCHAALGNDEMV